MGVDSSECSPDKEKGHPPPTTTYAQAEAEDSFSGIRLADAPILLLCCFHDAMREEITDLKRMAVTASEECGTGGPRRELVRELRHRLDFLRLAYKYHTAAEDEVIFAALDAHIKNIVCTYSLEHENLDDLFDSLFHGLNELEEEKNGFEPLQELVFCISIVQSSICKHMRKEEKQVFPLLAKMFSAREQSSLVWQFICSVPVILLEDMIPWMFSFISPEKQEDVRRCIEDIIPEENSLQEVVISWIHGNNQPSSGAFTKKREVTSNGTESTDSIPWSRCLRKPFGQNRLCTKAYSVQTDVGDSQSDVLHLWHAAIQKDLKEMLEELYGVRRSSNSPDMSAIIVRLKFLADVVIFYSIALKKFFSPTSDEFGISHFSPSFTEETAVESRIESLHRLLYCNSRNDLTSFQFMEQLCQELESLKMDVRKQFLFQETEVFPVISKYCSHETQQHLLYASLHVMPLGLLRCVITWFASFLSKNESNHILQSLNQGEFLENRSFASLLVNWFNVGYSGKISVENFGEDLHKMFKSRFSFLPVQIKGVVGRSVVRSNMQHSQESNPFKVEDDATNKGKKISSSFSLPSSYVDKAYEIPYSSEISLHALFSRKLRTPYLQRELHSEESSAASALHEPIPMDLIFFFHKALMKDLEYLVVLSAQLAENIRLLMKFCQHFHLLQFRYQSHSDAEDEIAFPALESKEQVQNISQSYMMDHEFEVKHFSEISLILDEISKFHVSISSVDSSMQDQRMVKHRQLCMKLHRTCKSMHKSLSSHVNREEIEILPLFRKCFSIQEQEKIVGRMLGRIKAETLQDMIPWLISSLTPVEQHAMLFLWRKVTKNTMFDEWLAEWWEGFDIAHVKVELNPSTVDPLEIISGYLSNEALDRQNDSLCNKSTELSQNECFNASAELQKNYRKDICLESRAYNELSEHMKLGKDGKRGYSEDSGATDETRKPGQTFQLAINSAHQEHLLRISQEDLEAAVRRVSRDSSLDPQRKSYIIQNLLMSGWIARQQISQKETIMSSNREEIPGQCPSYRDPQKLTFGCKHYRRNCKLVTPCCNQLFACIRCHDEEADHLTDRRAITKMMCMQCLVIQPIGQKCSTVSCNNFPMARYYCQICKLFDDEREIYHCPYCNLCRVGKGLGIDYFHCMSCNACMSWSLSEHVCREKCLEENCPICHEYIFTSSIPVKALPCGHLMHSTCFRDYTCTHYTCPICSKSLGDMRVYFKMLDALLMEEKIPDEYSGRTQAILCNDCEKKGTASFHWLYHKCPYCGSYNTRLL